MKKLINVIKSRFFIATFLIVLVFVELMVVYLLLYKWYEKKFFRYPSKIYWV